MGEPTSVEGRLITPSSSRNKFCMQKLCSVSLLCALLGCALLWVQADPSLDMIDHLLSLEDDISASASAQGGSSAAGSKGALGASSSENAKGKVNSTSSAVREGAESAKKAALERVDSAKSAANDILGKFNLSLANATSIKWHHVTSMYLSFNKMPLVQKTLSVFIAMLALWLAQRGLRRTHPKLQLGGAFASVNIALFSASILPGELQLLREEKALQTLSGLDDKNQVQTSAIYSGFGIVLVNFCAAVLMSKTFNMALLHKIDGCTA